MPATGIVEIALSLGVLTAASRPLGHFVADVLEGRRTFLSPAVEPLERACLRAAGVDAAHETGWKPYATAMLAFNLLGVLAVYAIQRLQHVLPLNPRHLGAVAPDVAFNTAVSFASNTNWQSYGGESAMSYFTQMAALTVQNFVSAASGIAVLAALIRGFARKSSDTIGNFWADLTRVTLHVLLPLAFVFALVLVSQGVVQSFGPPLTVRTLESQSVQDIAIGPVASQVAIKQLGTNGGGFFNTNSAHPFENPTPFTNFLEGLAILLLAAALCHTFGRMVSDERQGWALFAAMMLLFVAMLVPAVRVETSPNPALAAMGVDSAPSLLQPGGNMEGKEARFGPASSAWWAVATTAASNGSVNAMHDSFLPLGGLIPMALIQLGEVVFGGVGSGLYGMLVFALVTVFIAGLMVGRTPEYVGKKIEAYEMKMASLVVLLPAALVLVGTAIAVSVPAGTATLGNPGAHGFSEVLYAFSSAANNNGSAFAGLGSANPFYDGMLGVTMLAGRYLLAIPVLALAGSLAAKKRAQEGAGTLPTHTPLFVVLLAGIVVIVGALTFVPALALGPVVEHLQMTAAAATH
ncbi:MAG: potassium-transporting ATPase subunit KdpA [Candidatus Eisenbacteria bacterium]|uniref:Potassium-transporting ATPase potassium-binding subunit n=1 Tax=Eiseniibacteriota bacterium TaxID=2212470 RepID=A0A933SEN3_UNCEI|nr:potassium-transporting ATPase subunit KdpA [Candidatus Eisenbacteria bacterium]